MNYYVRSINIGSPKIHILNGKRIRTGFIKNSINEPIWLSKTGFEGDGQADLKNHGGEDKALLMYPSDHYAFWRNRYNHTFSIPAFGENITVDGLIEQEVHIGDIFSLGEATIQVSQPRQPCYKIAEVHQLKDIPALVMETGYSGFYFRVLKEGLVTPTDYLETLTINSYKISISYVFHTLFHDRENVDRMKCILEVDSIAHSLRATLTKRLDKLK